MIRKEMLSPHPGRRQHPPGKKVATPKEKGIHYGNRQPAQQLPPGKCLAVALLIFCSFFPNTPWMKVSPQCGLSQHTPRGRTRCPQKPVGTCCPVPAAPAGQWASHHPAEPLALPLFPQTPGTGPSSNLDHRSWEKLFDCKASLSSRG